MGNTRLIRAIPIKFWIVHDKNSHTRSLGRYRWRVDKSLGEVQYCEEGPNTEEDLGYEQWEMVVKQAVLGDELCVKG